MTYLFYFGHPAQYLFLRETMRRLIKANHKVVILIKTKDVLETLVQNDRFEYTNILEKTRGNSKLAVGLSLLKRNFKMIPIILKHKPDLLISTDASVAQLGRVFRINSICTLEDDYHVIKNLADITYPLVTHIVCPNVCSVGKWDRKKIGYEGFMKLGYLHPNVFVPNNEIIEKYHLNEPFFLIRTAKLVAFHDVNAKGISKEILSRLIYKITSFEFKVFISSESELDEEFSKYQLNIDVSDMHHVLYFANGLICDSQSMAVEASMLGVPSIRYSSFCGKISVLEELEHKYLLTKGVPSGDTNLLFNSLEVMLNEPDLKNLFKERKEKMLKDKIDVTSFMEDLLGNYPKSINKYKTHKN